MYSYKLRGAYEHCTSSYSYVKRLIFTLLSTLSRLFGFVFIIIRDEHILSKCGLDAVQYLSFQRNVILLVGIMTSISLGIVLPINFAGTLQGGDSAFGHTTVSNLEPQ